MPVALVPVALPVVLVALVPVAAFEATGIMLRQLPARLLRSVMSLR